MLRLPQRVFVDLPPRTSLRRPSFVNPLTMCYHASSRRLTAHRWCLFRRQHHCRLCGRVVCDPCSPARVTVTIGRLALVNDRVCGYCDEYVNITRPVLANDTTFTLFTGRFSMQGIPAAPRYPPPPCPSHNVRLPWPESAFPSTHDCILWPGHGESSPISLRVEDDDCIIFHSQGNRQDVLGNYPLAWLRQVVEGAETENFMCTPEEPEVGCCSKLCGTEPEPEEPYCVGSKSGMSPGTFLKRSACVLQGSSPADVPVTRALLPADVAAKTLSTPFLSSSRAIAPWTWRRKASWSRRTGSPRWPFCWNGGKLPVSP